MSRKPTAVIVALLLIVGAAELGDAAASLAYNLSGRWSSPLPPERGGTTLELTQAGNTVVWHGGPNDHAWLQEFTGALSGNVFSGEFSQHAAGAAQLYRGSLSAQVISECEFKTIHVIQVGLPDAGGATFTKTPCPSPPQPRFRFGFRLANRSIGLSTGSHGSFTTGQANGSGDLAVTSVSAGRFTATARYHGVRQSLSFAFTGEGSYAPAQGALELRLTVTRSNVGQCRSHSKAASAIELERAQALLTVCGRITEYAVPGRASDWISPA